MTFVIHYIPTSKDVNNKNIPATQGFRALRLQKWEEEPRSCVARLGKEQKGNQAVAWEVEARDRGEFTLSKQTLNFEEHSYMTIQPSK